jgi:endonuclease YncB( thermonuclease family)
VQLLLALAAIGFIAVVQWVEGGGRPHAATFATAPAVPDVQSASFAACGDGARINCVVDGDTFWIGGTKIRIAEFDTPELSPPRCDYERQLGLKAKNRLQALLNAGPFTLASIDRDEDNYGRTLRVVQRDGVSIGDTLINEGLARPWIGHRDPWCT